MSTLDDLNAAVQEYAQTYRHPDMAEYVLGPMYDLFPDDKSSPHSCDLRWPDTWPNCHDAGVYAFLDENLTVLYIGKSSINSSIGGRLSSYCVYGDQKSCRLLHEGWTMRPRFVWAAAVPKSTAFKASALEEYLIQKLQPVDNSAGRRIDVE